MRRRGSLRQYLPASGTHPERAVHSPSTETVRVSSRRLSAVTRRVYSGGFYDLEGTCR